MAILPTGMDYYDAFEQSLYLSTRQCLDSIGFSTVQAVYSSDDYLEPSKTYCVMDVPVLDQIGQTSEPLYNFDKGSIDFTTHYTAHVKFSVIGSDARAVAPPLRHNMVNNRKCNYIFLENGLGLVRKSGLNRIPQRRDSGWTEVFTFSLDFNFVFLSRQEYDYVEKAILRDEMLNTVTIVERLEE